MTILSKTVRGRNLLGEIQVPDGQVDKVREGIQRAETAGSIFNHSEDAIDALAGGIG